MTTSYSEYGDLKNDERPHNKPARKRSSISPAARFGGKAVISLLVVACVGIIGCGERKDTAPKQTVEPGLTQESELTQLLDASQPAIAAVLRKERSEGVHAALEQLRAYHRNLPQATFVGVVIGNAELLDTRSSAKRVMSEGYVESPYPAFSLDVPINWTADPFGNRSWKFKLNSWHFLHPVLFVHGKHGDAEYMMFARRIALDWIRQNIEKETTNEFIWYDMAAGLRAACIAEIADDALRDPAVADDELLLLLKAAEIHAQHLANPREYNSRTNHGLFQSYGLLALSLSLPEMRGAGTNKETALSRLDQQITAQFSSEGVQIEHSPWYHVWITDFLGRLVNEGRLEQHPELAMLFHEAAANTVWMAHPDGKLVRLGDTDWTNVVDVIACPFGPEMEFVLSEGKSGQAPGKTFAVFPATGYAAVRGPWNYAPWKEAPFLFFSAAFHSRTHKHADDFTFEWSELGKVLLVDAGKLAYDVKDPRRQYVESTRAHNTVEIDDTDYSRHQLDVFHSAIKNWGEKDGAYFVEARLFRKRFFQTDHRRTLVYKPGCWLVVIDELESNQERKFTQWFHFNPDLEMKSDGMVLNGPIPDKEKVLGVMPLLGGDKMTLELVKGQENPRLQGWISLEYLSFLPNYAAGYTLKGEKAAFVTLLILGGKSSVTTPGKTEISDDKDKLSVRWRTDGRLEGFDLTDRNTKAQIEVVPEE